MNIGIIGPKSYSIGHDPDEPPRSLIRNQIDKIVSDLIHKHQDTCIFGLTGLGLGIEQDFAHICISRKIEFIAYLPYDNQESVWANLPESITKNYKYLLDAAYDIKYISTGEYTPKKILQKKEQIVKDSDALIYVENKFCSLKSSVEQWMKGKKIPPYYVKY